MRTTLFATSLAVAAVIAGCGGTTGQRSGRLSPTQGIDAGGDVMVLPRFMCSGAVAPLDCSKPFLLNPDGHFVDFSSREWDSNGGKWCDESGFHGSIYSYTNPAYPMDTHAQRVDPDGTFHIVLTVSASQYGGGGLAFEAGCMDLSAFTGIQFTAAVASGSLSSCPLQFQIQTFDQRPTDQSPPGGCDKTVDSCFSFPSVTTIATSTDVMNPALNVLPFSSFSKISGALTQVVGLQWQVNAQGACTVDVSLDNVNFIPAAAPPEPGADGGATGDAATD